ncbi:vacuolar protein sorting 54 [Anaeramoeba ignava]|uniref:Vacuolar protein sorting 54 n=1 Tax=Anaeramoeba ignava TaxID=1746090 RepID=A0A9Q0R6A4_ANAIG|nr:vacuolar protein sorting 54 [Anaeramoeba ignava]
MFLRFDLFNEYVESQNIISIINDPTKQTWSDWFLDKVFEVPVYTSEEQNISQEFRQKLNNRIKKYYQSIKEIQEKFEENQKLKIQILSRIEDKKLDSTKIYSENQNQNQIKSKSNQNQNQNQNQNHSNQENDLNMNLETMKKIIPSIFFSPFFDLSNTEIFQNIYEIDSDSKVSLKPHQKAQHFLELIENKLSSELLEKTPYIFSSINELSDLTYKVQNTLQKITFIRDLLNKIDQDIVIKSIQITKSKTQQQNMNKLTDKMKLISVVKNGVNTAQLLLNNRDFAGALEVITTTKFVIENQLNGIQCIKGLKMELNKMNDKMKSELCEDFSKFCLNQNENQKEINDTYENLKPIILCLLNIKYLQDAFIQYNEKISNKFENEINKMIDDFLVSQNKQKENSNLPNNLIRQYSSKITTGRKEALKELDSQTFLEFIEKVYSRVIYLLKISLEVNNILKRIFQEILEMKNQNGNEKMKMKTWNGLENNVDEIVINQMIKDSESIINHACEISHNKCTRILQTRKESISIRLINSPQEMNNSIDEFLNLVSITQNFMIESEKTTKYKCNSLDIEIKNLTKKFIEILHKFSMEYIEKILVQDKWKIEKVPWKIQILFNNLDNKKVNLTDENSTKEPKSKDNKEILNNYLLVQGSKFNRIPAVKSVLFLFQILTNYMKCARKFSKSNLTDLMQKIIGILKQFNSRMCQLVLGAGAIQVAGLKRITTQNLALSSQTLNILFETNIKIQKVFSSLLPESYSPLLSEFDKLNRDYNEHKNEVFEKIIGIIQDVLLKQIESFNEIFFPLSQTTKNQINQSQLQKKKNLSKIFKANQTNDDQILIEKLSEDTKRLYSVLKQYIQKIELQEISLKIANIFVNEFINCFEKIEISVYPKSKKKRILEEISSSISILVFLEEILSKKEIENEEFSKDQLNFQNQFAKLRNYFEKFSNSINKN